MADRFPRKYVPRVACQILSIINKRLQIQRIKNKKQNGTDKSSQQKNGKITVPALQVPASHTKETKTHSWKSIKDYEMEEIIMKPELILKKSFYKIPNQILL